MPKIAVHVFHFRKQTMTQTSQSASTTRSIGSNTYLASYEGGDGNDLTLTVQ